MAASAVRAAQVHAAQTLTLKPLILLRLVWENAPAMLLQLALPMETMVLASMLKLLASELQQGSQRKALWLQQHPQQQLQPQQRLQQQQRKRVDMPQPEPCQDAA